MSVLVLVVVIVTHRGGPCGVQRGVPRDGQRHDQRGVQRDGQRGVQRDGQRGVKRGVTNVNISLHVCCFREF